MGELMVLTSWESTHELCTYNTKLSNLPLGGHKGKRSIPLLGLLWYYHVICRSDTFNCQCDALVSRFLFVFNCHPWEWNLWMKFKCIERNLSVYFFFFFYSNWTLQIVDIKMVLVYHFKSDDEFFSFLP